MQTIITNLVSHITHTVGSQHLPSNWSQWRHIPNAAELEGLPQQINPDCARYVVLISNCIIHNIPVKLLTPTLLDSCRPFLMKCLFLQHFPDFSSFYSPPFRSDRSTSRHQTSPTVNISPPLAPTDIASIDQTTPAVSSQPTRPLRRGREVSPPRNPTMLEPRKRLKRGAYAEDADLLSPHPPMETIDPGIPDVYLNKLYIAKSEDPPDAGWGLFAKASIPDKAIICEYAGRVDCLLSSPPSAYVMSITYADKTTHTIDAYDPITNKVLSTGGFANDPLAEHRENAEWITINNRLYLRATRDI